MTQFDSIPDELKQVQRWVLWGLENRAGKSTKVPYAITGEYASTIDPTTWTTFEQAYQEYEKDSFTYSGVGFVISAPYVGVDLDKCRNPETGQVEPWAAEALKELDSYTEVSPSGQGFHIWVKGWLTLPGNRKGKVEMYSRERYFTMTGQHVAGTPLVVNQRNLQQFHKKHIGDAVSDVKDESMSAREFKIACNLWAKLGRNATEEEVTLEFFKQVDHREKWEKNRQYISRTILAAKQKVFNLPVENENQLSQVRFTDIEAKAMAWLWENRIPKGKLVMFSGNPDCGKTTVLCDLIAHYTTGKDYPDGAKALETGEVLFLGAEDDPADTLKPRLQAAGANTDRVHYVKGIRVTERAKRLERAIALDTDLSAVEIALKQNPQIGLVAIDPITSYLGKSDLNKEQALRDVLVPIKNLAETMQVTFVCLGHFNKRSDVNVLHKVGGAVAMTGVARAVWLFMKNPEKEGQFLMLLGKGNLTRHREGLKYGFVEKMMPTGGVPTIEWQGEETMDAESVQDTLKDPKERAAAKAEKYLREFVAEGRGMLSNEILRIGRERGVKEATLWEVRKTCFEGQIKTEKKNNQWWWVPVQYKEENERSLYANF